MAKETKAELLARDAANRSYSKRLLCLLQNAIDCGYALHVVDDGFVLEDEENYDDFYLPYFYSDKGIETLVILECEMGYGPRWAQKEQEEEQDGEFDVNATFNDDHLYLDVNKLWSTAVKWAKEASPPDEWDGEVTIGSLLDFVKPSKKCELSEHLQDILFQTSVRVSDCSVHYYCYEDATDYHQIEESSFLRNIEHVLNEVEAIYKRSHL